MELIKNVVVEQTRKFIEDKYKSKQTSSRIKNGNVEELLLELSKSEISSDCKEEFSESLSCKFEYEAQKGVLFLHFFTIHQKWTLKSITGCFKSQDKQKTFAIVSEKQFECLYDDNRHRSFSLNLRKIIKHHLKEEDKVTMHLTIKINFCIDDIDEEYTMKYSFDIPDHRGGHNQNDAVTNITNLYNFGFKHSSELAEKDHNLLSELESYIHNERQAEDHEEFTKMMKYALEIEDVSQRGDFLKKYSKSNVYLNGFKTDHESKPDSFECHYFFEYPSDELPSNYELMMMGLIPMSKLGFGRKLDQENDCHFVTIDGVGKDTLSFVSVIKKDNFEEENLDIHQPYFMLFVQNQACIRPCLLAYDTIEEKLLQQYFFDFSTMPPRFEEKIKGNITKFRWFNPQISANEEQKQAIKNIVNQTSFPFPYVVHGPPGTGKTSLLIEAVLQILNVNPTARIMVTAQSNSACDEIGRRLLKYISLHRIFRYYSPLLYDSYSKVFYQNNVLLNSSNFTVGGHTLYPKPREIAHFNVIIVTLISSSRLKIPDDIKSNFGFDYIFVDECAAATEPEALVPIVGFATRKGSVTTSIVLLGDHKQLGPVVKSDFASRLGLDVSLMERVMKSSNYQINSITGIYNADYVTQLLDNFRSHPSILHFSNVLFYDSKLRAKIAEPERSFGTKWNYLRNHKFPILFHHCDTPSKVEDGGTSSYNEEEIMLVNLYVGLLMNAANGVRFFGNDIGIVSPYNAQIEKLKETLKHFVEVEIGTSEYFQGREKQVILSTVKSNSNNVGFLNNERRLNVCLTRAKSLLIVIGNAETLQKDKMWKLFIHYCASNNSVWGENFKLSKLTKEEHKKLDELNLIFSKSNENQNDSTPCSAPKRIKIE